MTTRHFRYKKLRLHRKGTASLKTVRTNQGRRKVWRVPVLFGGHNLPPGWDTVNWSAKYWQFFVSEDEMGGKCKLLSKINPYLKIFMTGNIFPGLLFLQKARKKILLPDMNLYLIKFSRKLFSFRKCLTLT